MNDFVQCAGRKYILGSRSLQIGWGDGKFNAMLLRLLQVILVLPQLTIHVEDCF